MQTRCPACDTLYRVRPRQLLVAGGWVRCSVCNEVFHGYENRVADSTLPAAPSSAPSRPPVPGTSSPDHPSAAQSSEDPTQPSFSIPRIAATGPTPAEQAPYPPALAATWQPPPRRSAARTFGWVLLILLALSVLLAQIGWYWRTDLLANPAIAHWAQTLCAALDCRLPPRRDLAQIELLSRDVRQHPAHGNALLITATLVNRAAFAQPWPLLEVSLSDLTGRTTALRRFLPSEYLSPGEAATLMAPEQPRTVVLEVQDPGVDAISFRFEFL